MTPKHKGHVHVFAGWEGYHLGSKPLKVIWGSMSLVD